MLEIYREYLISAFGQTTGTGLTALLDGSISNDQVQRFLAGQALGSADLWQMVKSEVRAMQPDDGVLIVDDSLAEKPYADENDIVCWHYDHAHDQLVKGINFLSALYHAGELSLPVGFSIVAKTEVLHRQEERQTKTTFAYQQERALSAPSAPSRRQPDPLAVRLERCVVCLGRQHEGYQA